MLHYGCGCKSSISQQGLKVWSLRGVQLQSVMHVSWVDLMLEAHIFYCKIWKKYETIGKCFPISACYTVAMTDKSSTWRPYPEEKPEHSGFYTAKVVHDLHGQIVEATCPRYYNRHLFAFELSDGAGKITAWREDA